MSQTVEQNCYEKVSENSNKKKTEEWVENQSDIWKSREP